MLKAEMKLLHTATRVKSELKLTIVFAEGKGGDNTSVIDEFTVYISASR